MSSIVSFVDQLVALSEQQPAAPSLTVGKNETVDYQTLWSRSVELADKLKLASKDSDFAFILCHRNEMQVIAIIAVLIAGVPTAIVDLRQGNARIANMLSQGNGLCGLVDSAGQKVLTELLAESKLTTVKSYLSLEQSDNECVEVGFTSDLKSHLPIDSALILFTSGSTGEPKGVCITKSDIDQRCITEKNWFELSQEDKILGVLPLNFDVGLIQLLGSLYSGAHHVMASSWLPADILKNIERWGVTGLALSPMVWQGLLKSKDHEVLWDFLNRLRYVTLSGGTLAKTTLDYVAKSLTQTAFIKTYGQTEMFRIAALKIQANETVDNADALYSVGAAYPNVSLSVVDDSGCETAIGTR